MFFVFILGLCFGSFVNVLVYRLPRYITLLGRSFCPKCRKRIAWFDNIPLLSFVLLRCRCRYCLKKISWQYPLVELVTALIFVLGFKLLAFSNFLFFALLTPIFLAIFLIDLKFQTIPDELTFCGILIAFLFSLFFLGQNGFYSRILAGFIASTFLLLLHLFTHCRGMGLGDVKFAVFGGMVTGLDKLLIWLSTAFLTGAAVGLILILAKKAKLKTKIAFGPFLIFALFLVLLLRL